MAHLLKQLSTILMSEGNRIVEHSLEIQYLLLTYAHTVRFKENL